MRLPNGRRSFNGVWGTTQKIKSQWFYPLVQLKFRLRHTVHDWILLADAQWPASLFCTHDSVWGLQLSFNWSLTWDFPMADAHSVECGEQLKRSILHGIVQFKFRLRHTVHHWILLSDAQWPAFPVRSELGEKRDQNEIKTRSETCRKNAIAKDAQSLRSQNTFTLRRNAGAIDLNNKEVVHLTKTLTTREKKHKHHSPLEVSILNISSPNMQFRKADAHLRQ